MHGGKTVCDSDLFDDNWAEWSDSVIPFTVSPNDPDYCCCSPFSPLALAY